jgi:hypothetical protein
LFVTRHAGLLESGIRGEQRLECDIDVRE